MGEWLRIEPEYRGVLSQLRLDSLEALLAGPGRRVRHSLHTNTYRLELPLAPGSPKALYIKAYCEEWPNPRYLVRPSRALREWRVLRGLRRRGIPAARPVAVGERRRFGALLDGVVVTEEVPASTELEQFLLEFCARPHTQGWCRRKRTYLEALARFTRAMHDAGYVSRDFHRRNILIAETDAGARQPDAGAHFAIIDNPRGLFLPSAALARWLGVRDLAALDRGASACFSQTDRLRFLRTYAGRPLRQCRGLLRRVSARASVRARAQAGVRREPVGPVSLVREGKCWGVFRAPGSGWRAPGQERATEPAMVSPGTLFQAARENTAGCFREWRRTSLFPLYAGYGPRGREWQNLRVLEALGVGVPRWRAFAQERAWGLARREVLLLAPLGEVEPLEQSLERSGARRLRRALAEALGREIGRAHGGGFCFRTFSAQDLGVRFPASASDVPIGSSAERAAAEPQPVFLNVGAGERRRRLSQRKRVRDLVSLATCFSGRLKATEMLCFFRGYLGRPLTSADKGLVRAVMQRYQERGRAGRPLSGAESGKDTE